MDFIKFKEIMQNHFVEMTKDVKCLFEVEVDKDELWNLYLDSFPAGTNEIYRECREYDCSCCKQFIRNIGNAVVIKNNQVHTIWDLELNDTTYQPVVDALSAYIKSHAVTNIYVSKFKKIGTDHNREQLNNGEIVKWDHFYLELPDVLVNRSCRSVGDIQGEFRDTRNVFKRSMDEISEEEAETMIRTIEKFYQIMCERRR